MKTININYEPSTFNLLRIRTNFAGNFNNLWLDKTPFQLDEDFNGPHLDPEDDPNNHMFQKGWSDYEDFKTCLCCNREF